jgi:hypothetical protein
MQMMNLLMLAKQGNHEGIAPTCNNSCFVGAIPRASPEPMPSEEIIPRNVSYLGSYVEPLTTGQKVAKVERKGFYKR